MTTALTARPTASDSPVPAGHRARTAPRYRPAVDGRPRELRSTRNGESHLVLRRAHGAAGPVAPGSSPRPALRNAQSPTGWDPLAFRPQDKPVASRRSSGIPAARRQTARRQTEDRSAAGTAPSTAQAAEEAIDARRIGAVVVAVVEVLSGHRGADQLVRLTTPELFDALSRRAGLAGRLRGSSVPGPRPQLRSAHVAPAPTGGWEVTVTIEWQDRVRACAAHVGPHRGRQVLTSLAIA